MQNAQDTGMDIPPGESAGTAREMKNKVSGVVAGAKELLVEGAKARATGAIDERKDTAAQGLGTVAEALREAANKLGEGEAGPLGSYAESAAEQVDKVARYLREKDLQTITRDAQTFARRHPEVFLGGAFLAGIFAARFLKSSSPRTQGDGGMGYVAGYQGNGGYQAGYGQGASDAYGSTGSGTVAYATDQTTPFNPPHITPIGGE